MVLFSVGECVFVNVACPERRMGMRERGGRRREGGAEGVNAGEYVFVCACVCCQLTHTRLGSS